ncbi:hypothetical protein SGLAM104S_02719 [Streptomyces glaucescens]
MDQDGAAGLRGELAGRGRVELPQPRRVELVGRVEAFGGLSGCPAQCLQRARGGARHAQRLGLPRRHLAQAGEQPGEVGLAEGGDVVLLAGAAGHLGVERAGESGRPLAVRHAGRHGHREVRPDQVAHPQFTALADGRLGVRCEAQHMAGADPPGGGLRGAADRPDVGAGGGVRSLPEQGADQSADGVRGGCRCLGHGRPLSCAGRTGTGWRGGVSPLSPSRAGCCSNDGRRPRSRSRCPRCGRRTGRGGRSRAPRRSTCRARGPVPRPRSCTAVRAW